MFPWHRAHPIFRLERQARSRPQSTRARLLHNVLLRSKLPRIEDCGGSRPCRRRHVEREWTPARLKRRKNDG